MIFAVIVSSVNSCLLMRIFQAWYVTAAQEWWYICSRTDQLAAHVVSARCLPYLLLQSLEGNPYVGQGKNTSFRLFSSHIERVKSKLVLSVIECRQKLICFAFIPQSI